MGPEHREAVFTYTESIRLGRAPVVPRNSYHLSNNTANSLHALGQHRQANTATFKALQVDQGKGAGTLWMRTWLRVLLCVSRGHFL